MIKESWLKEVENHFKKLAYIIFKFLLDFFLFIKSLIFLVTS
jgi:hypothetical protein